MWWEMIDKPCSQLIFPPCALRLHATNADRSSDTFILTISCPLYITPDQSLILRGPFVVRLLNHDLRYQWSNNIWTRNVENRKVSSPARVPCNRMCLATVRGPIFMGLLSPCVGSPTLYATSQYFTWSGVKCFCSEPFLVAYPNTQHWVGDINQSIVSIML